MIDESAAEKAALAAGDDEKLKAKAEPDLGPDIGKVTVRQNAGAAPAKKNRKKKSFIPNFNLPGGSSSSPVYEAALKASSQSHSFKTSSPGAHTVCVSIVTASATSPALLSFAVSVGLAASRTLSEGVKGHLTDVEKTLADLTSQATAILSESDYAKDLEIDFHAQSAEMNTESWWWPVVRIGVMVKSRGWCRRSV